MRYVSLLKEWTNTLKHDVSSLNALSPASLKLWNLIRVNYIYIIITMQIQNIIKNFISDVE